MKRAILGLALLLAACVEMEAPATPASRDPGPVGVSSLQRVARAVMPVAERECLRRTDGTNCNYLLAVDEDPRQPPNAFQSLSKDGRPQITVTLTLLDDLKNTDELAFILGHEAAHHIKGHLQRTNTNATVGAILGGVIAGAIGADYTTIDSAQRAGAVVGSRAYSKNFELEADRLGAVITKRAGYDPVRGAEYFTRIADPGNAFLGTHPPNADRIRTVREAVAGM